MSMRTLASAFCTAAFLTASPSASFADPQIDCVDAFFDANMYGWYSFRNSCNIPVKIAYQGHDGLMKGALTLGPGRSDSTGSSSREVASHGGVRFVACDGDETPMGSDGRYWDGTKEFWCKKR